MHIKLCMHAQFYVLNLYLGIPNTPLSAKLNGMDENEFDIAFEDNYNSMELLMTIRGFKTSLKAQCLCWALREVLKPLLIPLPSSLTKMEA